MPLFVITFNSCDDDEPSTRDIDLMAGDIVFSATGIDPNLQDFEGTATITGYIHNIGTDDFVSGENQQQIYLDEVSLGGGVTLVAIQPFARLDAGDSLSVTYSRAWNISSPAEGEFAPDYSISIGYDPDIYLDGNLDNDDKSLDNNEATESGHQINELF